MLCTVGGIPDKFCLRTLGSAGYCGIFIVEEAVKLINPACFVAVKTLSKVTSLTAKITVEIKKRCTKKMK